MILIYLKETSHLVVTLLEKEKGYYEVQKEMDVKNSKREIFSISRSSVSIIKNILPNTKHKKHQVRSAALDSLASILLQDIPHAKNTSSLILLEEIIAEEENNKQSKFNTFIFQQLIQLSSDSSASLRVSLYTYLLRFIHFFTFQDNEEETKVKLRSKFLSILVVGLFDVIPSIQSQCFHSIDSLGVLFLQIDSKEEVLMGNSISSTLLPSSFKGSFIIVY